MNVPRPVWVALYVMAGLGAVVLAVVGFLCFAGGRWNLSASIPVGLYWTSKSPISRGALVVACPPNTKLIKLARERTYIDGGNCPGGYGHLMKQVVAVGGDVVQITTTGVVVNGHAVPDSAPLIKDPDGRPMPSVSGSIYTLPSRELLLMGVGNPLSFDARYFGPVGRESIIDVITPVYTWANKE